MATVAYETILIERQGHVGLVTLNRPERRNAYTSRMGAELQAAFAELEADESVRAIVVKRMMYRFLAETDRDAANALEARVFGWMGTQADAREGVTAFLEKRPPAWKLSKHAELPFEL